ncbi:MAG: alpha-galactosidase [Candidatus Hydrogenedentes bacterium]|nr:alpha-galactosidase [Candidatus Hydrogenedentota bacterium]
MLRKSVLLVLLVLSVYPRLAAQVAFPDLPLEGSTQPQAEGDWLIDAPAAKAGVYRNAAGNEISMSNRLVRRSWRVSPNAATVAYDNLMTGAAIIRGVKPEAMVEINGERFSVGGLQGQPDYAYLKPEWVDAMTADPAAFQCVSVEYGKTAERFAWKREGRLADVSWPPPGVSLVFHYKAPEGKLPGVSVSVHYELYDALPVLAKWVAIRNEGEKPIQLNSFISEVLAAVEYQSMPESLPRWEYPNIHVESDFGYGGLDPWTSRCTAYWVPDPQYTTQVNYALQSPVQLECRLPIGPDVTIAPGGTFETFRTFELVYDSTERERKGLALRRMYRTLAPWVMDNPIMLHVRQSDPEAVRLALDQCAEVGAEMAILSFGSGFDMENEDPSYIAQIKALVDYAHGKGVRIGGYSLLASRRISDEDDVINPATGKPGQAIFGNSPCLGSKWGQEYFRKLKSFIEQTGLDLLEHDGSYPGDLCASTAHPGHKGLNDSLWCQYLAISEFYHWCRERGVFLNVPDWYMLSGSNKTGMGYRETNWSLPRERQLILGRQNIYDGTWGKTPTMGWMFVPLVEYQGGGVEATLEPLSEHLDTYGAHMAQNFGAGVQACYRGPRWYDTDATRDLVRRWITFFKQYRDILESDIIHVRRPDGREIDCILHVNAHGKPRGLAMAFNPLDQSVTANLTLPLYYTGATETAVIRLEDGLPAEYRLDRQYNVTIPVEVPASGNTWLIVE